MVRVWKRRTGIWRKILQLTTGCSPDQRLAVCHRLLPAVYSHRGVRQVAVPMRCMRTMMGRNLEVLADRDNGEKVPEALGHQKLVAHGERVLCASRGTCCFRATTEVYTGPHQQTGCRLS